MAFTLWNLLEATVLCLNAVCILNEERFLVKTFKIFFGDGVLEVLTFRVSEKILLLNHRFSISFIPSEQWQEFP
ncbi:hypothetical protein JTB14_014828 [Gonioctena quinquepunctata]|nr:hypothetical protein JTB14_014828 [Gonioctena quinquepunctata]